MTHLSKREVDVLRHLQEPETSTATLAEALGITLNTAKSHCQHIREKLCLSSIKDCVALANELGLL